MMNQGMINIDDFELAYSIEGEGPPVLVVGSSVYYPRLFSEEIRKQLKLIFIDHRGFVRSPRSLTEKDYSLDQILDDIEVMREVLQLEDFIILGHSGNAFLALEYVKKYPAHVRKVVLLNTAPTNSQERQEKSFAFFHKTASPKRKEKFEQEIALLEADIQKDPQRRFAHVCIRMGAQSFYDYTFHAAYMWDGVYTNMQIIDYLWGEAFGKLNLIQSLTKCDKAVFLGLGKYDYLVGPYSLWDSVTETFSNVTKIIFKHSGHNPMFEEPTAFDSSLVNWIYQK